MTEPQISTTSPQKKAAESIPVDEGLRQLQDTIHQLVQAALRGDDKIPADIYSSSYSYFRP